MTNRHGSHPRSLTRRGGVSTQLDREWRRLRGQRRAVTTARSWPAPPLLASVTDGLQDLQRVVDATQRDGSGRGDRVLLELVEVARNDTLAARVVLQRILPGVLAASARYRSFGHGDGTDSTELAIAAAWEAIRTFDTANRRRNVAASLISDSVDAALRRPRRRRSADDELRASTEWDEDAVVVHHCSFEELARVVAEARQHGVDREHLRLIGDLVRTGSTTRIATERGVTDRTIRNHRARAVASVRQAMLMDAA